MIEDASRRIYRIKRHPTSSHQYGIIDVKVITYISLLPLSLCQQGCIISPVDPSRMAHFWRGTLIRVETAHLVLIMSYWLLRPVISRATAIIIVSDPTWVPQSPPHVRGFALDFVIAALLSIIPSIPRCIRHATTNKRRQHCKTMDLLSNLDALIDRYNPPPQAPTSNTAAKQTRRPNPSTPPPLSRRYQKLTYHPVISWTTPTATVISKAMRSRSPHWPAHAEPAGQWSLGRHVRGDVENRIDVA